THWPEYLMEAGCLGLFMVSACSFSVLLQHPESSLRQEVSNPFLRRMLIRNSMGLTANAPIFLPSGEGAGARLHSSVTLSFFRLGKLEPWDALFYVLAQFIGGIVGVRLCAWFWGEAIAQEKVRYAVTLPGNGTGTAFVAELLISFVMMTMVLNVSNSPHMARFTGVIAGALVATYITLESPLSGMSMSPARSFASAFSGRNWELVGGFLPRPAVRNAARGRGLLALVGQTRGLLREAAPRQRQALHIPLQLQGFTNPITLKETM